MAFDPYWEWFRIPPRPKSPSPEVLLGVSPLETDTGKIDEAAQRRREFLKPIANLQGEEAEHARRLLLEVGDAVAALRRRLAAPQPEPGGAGKTAPPPVADADAKPSPPPPSLPEPRWGAVSGPPAPADMVGPPLPTSPPLVVIDAGDALPAPPASPITPLAPPVAPPYRRQAALKATASAATEGSSPEPLPQMPSPTPTEASPQSDTPPLTRVLLLSFLDVLLGFWRALTVAVRPVVRGVERLIRRIDAVLRWLAGEENVILHGFLRLLTVVAFGGAMAFGVRRLSNSPPVAESSETTVPAEVQASPDAIPTQLPAPPADEPPPAMESSLQMSPQDPPQDPLSSAKTPMKRRGAEGKKRQ